MVFTYPGKLTDGSCALRPWMGGMGFAIVFAPMIAKVERERERKKERGERGERKRKGKEKRD
jgi:hypothetical protein